MKYLFIGIAGFIGAILRYEIKNINYFETLAKFPIGTFIVNIMGCFIIGLFLTITNEKMKMNENLKLAVSVGFLGAFTTFSTFIKEIIFLWQSSYYLYSIIYLTCSIIFGFIFVKLGILVPKRIYSKVCN